MNEHDTPLLKNPRRKLPSFSLSFLLIIITLIALVTIYVNYQRERGNDVLHRTLAEVSIYEHIEGAVEKAWSDPWLGNSNSQVIGRTVSFDPSLIDREVRIDRAIASRLAKNLHTGNIMHLRFANATVDPDAVCFFRNWKQVRSVQIRDTPLPEPWTEAIKQMPALEEVVISGGLCTIEPESLQNFPALRKLTLCHRNVNSARLEELKKLLPRVQILLLGSTDRKYDYPENSATLSQHDPQAHSELKQSLDRLKKTLQSLDPPAKNSFNPPATEAEILKYEQHIGVPLHRSVRALFEIHNGQPSAVDELITFEKLLSVGESIGNMEIERDAAGELESWYNFDPDYDWMNNPNLIGIGSSEADVLYVHNVSGKVYHAYEGLSYAFPTLAQYFDAINEEVKAGRFERSDYGSIRLTEYTTGIAKKWPDRKKK